MTKILEIAKELIASGAVETADEVEVVINETMTSEEQLIVYLNAVVNRSNKILDAKNKQRIFTDVLSLNTRGDVERALTAYDRQYLLQLPLSLDSVVELAKELISLAASYGISPPKAWKNIAKYDVGITYSTVNLMNRKKAGI